MTTETTPTAATNCLKGIRCPKCGHDEAFRLVVNVLVLITDKGIQDDLSCSEWDNSARCECDNCDLVGTVKTFMVEHQPAP